LKKYGIEVQDVSLTNFEFSAAFNQAIESVQIANQKVAQAQQELAQAQVDAQKTVAQAQAQADSQRLQQQTLTPELLEKMWIEKWDGKLPTTAAGNQSQFYIPTR
jgi:regulator of protease activity HflC (stomatin/prohibitin superfamily)